MRDHARDRTWVFLEKAKLLEVLPEAKYNVFREKISERMTALASRLPIHIVSVLANGKPPFSVTVYRTWELGSVHNEEPLNKKQLHCNDLNSALLLKDCSQVKNGWASISPDKTFDFLLVDCPTNDEMEWFNWRMDNMPGGALPASNVPCPAQANR
jgi:hypothetical protein